MIKHFHKYCKGNHYYKHEINSNKKTTVPKYSKLKPSEYHSFIDNDYSVYLLFSTKNLELLCLAFCMKDYP